MAYRAVHRHAPVEQVGDDCSGGHRALTNGHLEYECRVD